MGAKARRMRRKRQGESWNARTSSEPAPAARDQTSANTARRGQQPHHHHLPRRTHIHPRPPCSPPSWLLPPPAWARAEAPSTQGSTPDPAQGAASQGGPPGGAAPRHRAARTADSQGRSRRRGEPRRVVTSWWAHRRVRAGPPQPALPPPHSPSAGARPRPHPRPPQAAPRRRVPHRPAPWPQRRCRLHQRKEEGRGEKEGEGAQSGAP